MLQQKICTLLAASAALLASALVASSSPAFAQRPGQFEEQLQGAASEEAQARASNTSEAWRAAGLTWMSQGSMVSKNENHRDWVKDTYNPATRGISVQALKRAVACFVKAYDLEGVHDNARSRARSVSLTYLQQAYRTLAGVDPGNAAWPYLQGEALCAQGLYKQADPQLKRAVQLGGPGGTKASALLAHTKPFLAHQLTNDKALWDHNEAVDKYNAAHYVAPTNTRRGVNYSDLYIRTRDYQASHSNAGTGDHY